MIWSTKTAFKEFNYGLREIQYIAFFVDIFFSQVVLYHVQCHIPYHFRRWSYFNNITKHHVYLMVHFLDVSPTITKPYHFSLLLQVRVLTARHFMLIYFSIRICFCFIYTFVVWSNATKVMRHFFHVIDVHFWLTFMTRQCIVHGVHARLRSTISKC